jgi:hypothetical protein
MSQRLVPLVAEQARAEVVVVVKVVEAGWRAEGLPIATELPKRQPVPKGLTGRNVLRRW